MTEHTEAMKAQISFVKALIIEGRSDAYIRDKGYSAAAIRAAKIEITGFMGDSK